MTFNYCFIMKIIIWYYLSKNTLDSVKCPYSIRLIILLTLNDCSYSKKLCDYSANDLALQGFEVFFLR